MTGKRSVHVARRVDGNQSELVAALRAAGATVLPLHAVGQGCPDLLVGYKGANYLLEVKDGNLSPSRRRLTDDQRTWHASWTGQVAVVCNVYEALRAVGVPHG